MTSSIQTKANRKNYFAVPNIYDENGKRKPKWIDTGVPVKGNNKRLSNKMLQEILVEYDEKGVDTLKDAYFTDFLVQWFETIKVSVSSTTHDSYRYMVNYHIIPLGSYKK